MKTTDYFPISPRGIDEGEIEAFGSIFCRMAVAHSVSVYVLAMHLRTWWSHRHPDDARAKINVINAMNPMLCGIGPNVGAYLDIVSEATGCRDLERTTFLPLSRALGSNGVGLVRAGRAWCPACHTEDLRSMEMVYDRLLWAIPVIRRCPVHRVALETHCPACSSPQLRYHHMGRMDLCCKCKRPLLADASRWKVELSPLLYERECVQLTSALSSGHLVVATDAWQVFIHEFANYMAAIGKKVSKFAYRSPRRPQLAREAVQPRFSTLLRRCAAFGIDPTHLLSEPADAAKSACIFEFARLEIPEDRKPLRPLELLSDARARICLELQKPDFRSLCSLATIARELGVSKGFLNYRLPTEVAELAAHRRACHIKLVRDDRQRALCYLMSGPILHYPSSVFPSHDHLVAAVVKECGLGVHRARQVVGVAMKRKLGDRKYKDYRRAADLHRPRDEKCDR